MALTAAAAFVPAGSASAVAEVPPNNLERRALAYWESLDGSPKQQLMMTYLATHRCTSQESAELTALMHRCYGRGAVGDDTFGSTVLTEQQAARWAYAVVESGSDFDAWLAQTGSEC